MDTFIYSNKDSGFSGKQNTPSLNERHQQEKPALGFTAFFSGEFALINETEKWGAVLPMEITKNLPVMMAVSTQKSHAGSHITVQWISTDEAVRASFGPVEVSVPGNVEFIKLPLEQLEQFSGKSVNATALIERDGNIVISPPLRVEVAPQLLYQPAIIDGLVNGGIDTGSHPQGRLITIPIIENLRPYNSLLLQWRVYAGGEKVFAQSVELQACRPDEAFLYTLPTEAYAPYKGLKGEFQWFIQLGAEKDSRMLWSSGTTFFDLR